ncbi:glycine cleavage system protein R [Reinekea sp.]|jgi:glycine cleavage system regulatory protein|uniref:glycine cleavage system protein R n=1 Tax=Reinekea sp. TaxID=1970455 RepID=UPI0039899537
MNVQVLITITGMDQADLVKTLSHKTHALGGKWLNSKISHIDHYMAGLIKVELPKLQLHALLEEFRALPIQVEWVELEKTAAKTKQLQLSIDTKDRAGLVRDISEILSNNSVVVDSMECNRVGVSGISDVVFTSRFLLSVSENFDPQVLTSSLQEMQDELLIDITAA